MFNTEKFEKALSEGTSFDEAFKLGCADLYAKKYKEMVEAKNKETKNQELMIKATKAMVELLRFNLGDTLDAEMRKELADAIKEGVKELQAATTLLNKIKTAKPAPKAQVKTVNVSPKTLEEFLKSHGL